MPSEAFDLIVIGSGPAGEKGAAQAAYLNRKVALVERSPTPGGIAVSSAGIPTKTLRESALYIGGFRKREIYGLSLKLDPQVTLERLMTRKAEVVTLMTRAVERNIQKHGIKGVTGSARLLGGNRVQVTDAQGQVRELEAPHILVATGSHPVRPPELMIDDPDVHDADSIVGLDRLPQSLIVLGGGSVGCEYASIFSALGVKVSLVAPRRQLLSYLDEEMSQTLMECLNGVGIRLMLGTTCSKLERVTPAAGTGPAAPGPAPSLLRATFSNGKTLEAEKVLVAVGRAGNTAGLGLAEAGVQVNEAGDIVVDPQFRTTAPGIYAAGDVVGPPRMASVSMEQARVAVCHALGFPFKLAVDALAPTCIYSIPEVASVGLSEARAKAAGLEFEVGRCWFSANTQSRVSGFTEGLIKLVFKTSDRSLLGVHIVGELASELIHLGQAVLHEGGSLDRFIHATFAVPSRSEAYKYAAYDGLARLQRRQASGPRA